MPELHRRAPSGFVYYYRVRKFKSPPLTDFVAIYGDLTRSFMPFIEVRQGPSPRSGYLVISGRAVTLADRTSFAVIRTAKRGGPPVPGAVSASARVFGREMDVDRICAGMLRRGLLFNATGHGNRDGKKLWE